MPDTLPKRLWTIGNKARMFVSMVFCVCSSLYPILYAEWLRRVVSGIENQSLAVRLVVVGLLIFLIQLLLQWSRERFNTRFYNRLVRDLREILFCKLTTVNLEDASRFSTSEILTRYRQDAEGVASFYAQEFQSIIGIAISFVGAFGYFFTINPLFLPVCIIPAAVTFFAVGKIRKKQVEIRKAYSEISDGISSLYEDIAYGYSDIKQGGVEEIFMAKAEEIYERNASISITSGKCENFIFFISMLSHSITSVLVILSGVIFVYFKWCDVGAIVATHSLFYMLSNPVRNLSRYLSRWQIGKVAYQRVNDFYALKDEVREGKQGLKLALERSPFEVHISGYQYPGDSPFTLQKIDFEVQAGSYTAIIGRSGCGKSTLAKLLVGYSDAFVGIITCFGAEQRTISLDELRKQVHYVANDFWVLDEELIDYVMPGQTEDKELFDRVMGIVELSDYVGAQPQRERSRTGSNGDKLSGGQRQRLILAKAVAEKGAVYIFDEIFSAVDSRQAERILKRIREFLPGVTILSVTHDRAAARQADKIVYLEKSCPAMVGSHEELCGGCEGYRSFAGELPLYVAEKELI